MPNKLSARNFRHQKIVELTIQGKSMRQISQELGCVRPTIERTLARPEVQETLSEALANLNTKLIDKLPPLIEKSLDTLMEAQSGFLDTTVRVRAATAALNVMVRLSELTQKSQQSKDMAQALD